VNSTKVIASIAANSEKIRKFYLIFINTMATIAKNFNAKVIKNAGDSLIFYFPKTSNSNSISAFKDVIECGLTMIAARSVINSKLHKEGLLLSIDYRISADYGKIEMARSGTSQVRDMFGPTINMCSKLNSKAQPNEMVIGGDLHQIVKKSRFNDYIFKHIGEYSLILNHPYPVYSVTSRYDRNNWYNNTPTIMQKQMTTTPTDNILRAEQKKMISSVANTKTTTITRDLDFYTNQQEQRQQKSSSSSSYKNNILLVDDDKDILYTYTSILENEGYNVEGYSDSQEALKQFTQNDPCYYDLVILDIRMPGLNGLQLYYRLKAMNIDIKVIFVSALDSARELVSILPDINIDEVIKKPVNVEQFANAIKESLP
jgi:CheY-like chemotaxis protein